MTHAEIGVDHRLVALDRGRRAVADLLAVVEDHDAIGYVHDHAHVVLDQADRGAELVVHVEDEAAHVLLLLDVHAGHRLPGPPPAGLPAEPPAELDPPLPALWPLPRPHLSS